MEKKLVLPGDHLSSAEEAEAGENTYVQNDEIYSASAGEDASSAGQALVKAKNRTIELPHVGMSVYGLVIKASPNKAIAGCMTIAEAEGGKRGVEIEAVLPVTAIRGGYVRDLRDEVKIGDIIKAKIKKKEKTGFEISIAEHDCGVMVAFCPKDRTRMEIKDRIFICPRCSWKERRKLPLKEGEAPPEGYEERRSFGERRDFGERRGPPREGGYRGPRREGSGYRREGGSGGGERRPFGRRPGPGGREGSY